MYLAKTKMEVCSSWYRWQFGILLSINLSKINSVSQGCCWVIVGIAFFLKLYIYTKVKDASWTSWVSWLSSIHVHATYNSAPLPPHTFPVILKQSRHHKYFKIKQQQNRVLGLERVLSRWGCLLLSQRVWTQILTQLPSTPALEMKTYICTQNT